MLKLVVVSSLIRVAMTEQDKNNTNPPFSKEDVALIREAVTAGRQVECPQCGSPLTAERPVAGEGTGEAVWWIHCTTCRRNLILHDLTEPPLGGGG